MLTREASTDKRDLHYFKVSEKTELFSNCSSSTHETGAGDRREGRKEQTTALSLVKSRRLNPYKF